MNKVVVSIEDLAPQIEETLNNNQIFELKIKGTSMNPALKNNSSIVGLKKYDGKLKKHRMYFYRYNDKYILHRFVKRNDNQLYFKGDALHTYEILLNDEEVIASVEYVIVNGKNHNPYSLLNKLKYRISKVYMGFKRVIRKLVK